MDQLLTPLQTRPIHEVDIVPAEKETRHTENQEISLSSPEDAVEILKSRPDRTNVSRVLRWLDSSTAKRDGFSIRKPSPKAAQIIYVLVTDIIPDYWDALGEGSILSSRKLKNLLTKGLSSVAGLGAIASHLRLTLDQLKDSHNKNGVKQSSRTNPTETLLRALECILNRDSFVASLWEDIDSFYVNDSQKFLQWKEAGSILASGKLLSAVSEANHLVNEFSTEIDPGSWIGDGPRYATWLGRSIHYMIAHTNHDEARSRQAIAQMTSRALTLGYTDKIVHAVFSDLMAGDEKNLRKYRAVISSSSSFEQKTLLYSVVRVLSQQQLSTSGNQRVEPKAALENRAISGVAAVIAELTKDAPDLQDSLIEWLTAISSGAVGQSHNTQRAVIATLSCDSSKTKRALQRTVELLGDRLYIKHIPLLQQEVNAQILLLLAGYVYRADRMHLIQLSKSSVYLNAISNRLAASSPKARFLGMVVGSAVSELVDAEGKRLNFSTEDITESEGQWYKSLTGVEDTVGSIEDLKPEQVSPSKPSITTKEQPTGKGKQTIPAAGAKVASKIISIEEVEDSVGSEDEGLPMYEKPDSDPEDEDEDPTLVQRNRPTAPVYIRDLISGLRDTENFDRHRLALTNAATLIRRKAVFGTEVSDNIEELATILVGLGDKWEMDKFHDLRLQGMIAVLVAEPLIIGQWFSKTFYNGDYSIGQRVSILTTLGIGAREIAGLGKEDAAVTGAAAAAENPFPSKRLPDKLHQLYALEAAPMDALSSQLEKTMIQPLAAEAADQVSGPNALKVRTFSSRLAVEKKRKKPIPNALAKIVAEGFFFPLTGRWRIHLQAFGDKTTHTSPPLLSHLLKTLSLILHAAGSSSLSLPQLTSEFWDLLLSLRSRATDLPVLEALLFSFLTLLEVNGDNQRRVAEEHAKELLETQGWVEGIFERIGGKGEEEGRVRMLAAGVLMRCREVVEKWQRVLMGELVEFM